jgi:hypothetical protein
MDAVDVIIVKKLTSEVSPLYSLPPLTAAEHPMAYNRNMTEVILDMSDCMSVSRSSIKDVIFIVPFREVESGMFHLAGSSCAFFIRYFVKEDGMLRDCNAIFYFERSAEKPISHRFIFRFE